MLFGLWEGWDTLQSAYFCFVTLSTIGFGDVVPGTDFDNPQAPAQLILGAIYVLFGKWNLKYESFNKPGQDVLIEDSLLTLYLLIKFHILFCVFKGTTYF